MDDSRTRAWTWNIEEEPGISFSARNKGSAQTNKNTEDTMSKGHQSQLKELPIAKDGTIWFKINQVVLDYNQQLI